MIAILVKYGPNLEAGTHLGATSLHVAAQHGHTEVISVLIKAGADLEASDNQGFSPLHLAVWDRHSLVVMALLKAGADFEASTLEGSTPLYMAAEGGQSAVVAALIETGANPDTRVPSGGTPLSTAAARGHVGVVKILLDADASALLGSSNRHIADDIVPLDVAALKGHSEVVRELIQQRGVKGCGGASGGVQALVFASEEQRMYIMATLVDAGVVDTGVALCGAARSGSETSVKFLLQRQEEKPVGWDAYVNARDLCGATPLMNATITFCCCAPRVVRLLTDAGADTTSAFGATRTPGGMVEFIGTPLALTTDWLREKKFEGEELKEEQLHSLERIRRLLLQVDAVHATSWLWYSDAPSTISAAAEKNKNKTTSNLLRMTLPTLSRRARRRGVVLTPLLR